METFAITSVFISHAGSNKDTAQQVASFLQHARVKAVLDMYEIKPGMDFIDFMERALAESSYCLLLWSKEASASSWVKLEWEAALHKTLHESPGFLIVGRLEDFPLPHLLRPRLYIDLFPQIVPNLQNLLDLLAHDRQASEQSQKKVVHVGKTTEMAEGTQVYITSKFFGKTFPLRTSFIEPVIAIVDRLVRELALPREEQVAEVIRIRFDYSLASGQGALDPLRSLDAQGVRENEVLWLETNVQPYAGQEPVDGSLGSARYRSGKKESFSPAESTQWMLTARDLLMERVRALDLH